MELFRVDVDFDGLTGLPVFDLQLILRESVLTVLATETNSQCQSGLH